ncbi:MAG: ABC transporter ATP-binding protein [Gemmataceae bacterium]
MNDKALLRTENLCKLYPDGQVNALVDVNVRIGYGEFVAIMGPSGSGKSTLLNLLGALDRPSSGEVYFEGQPLSSMKRLDMLRAMKIGFVFQSFYLLPTLTALENVQVPMFEGPLSVRERVNKARALLGSVGLEHRLNHLPVKLSVGERQRVAVARALANDPLLLLADEPTGNLDSRTAADVLDLFDNLHRDHGLTIVMVTHGLEVAQRAQRIIHMRDGRVVQDEEGKKTMPEPASCREEG